MKRRDKDYLSVQGEPAHGAGGPLEIDPAEARVAAREAQEAHIAPAEIDAIRDSVLSEPTLDEEIRGQLSAEKPDFARWLTEKKRSVSLGALVGVTLLAGIAGGPYSILAALFQGGSSTVFMLIYAVIIGPVVEEMLKQSGALFLLERRPWWLRFGWQFPVIAVISASLFATIENLMYINGPLQELEGAAFTEAVRFRWRVCTALHIGCSLLASVGMWRIWKRQVADGRPAHISDGYRWIVTAVVAHGLYNLSVSFWWGPGN